MEVMSAREAADRWGISQRRVAVLCSENRIANAQMLGNMWLIPINAEKPIDARSTRYNTTDEKTVKPFLKWAGGKGQLLKEIENCIVIEKELNKIFGDLLNETISRNQELLFSLYEVSITLRNVL